MSAFPRPGTPFPHIHSLSHSSSSSSSSSSSTSPTSYFSAQPLHFSPRTLPARTPPSLLHRTPSTSASTQASTSTAFALRQPPPTRRLPVVESESEPATPALERRRSSTSSSYSPLMPTTPSLAHGGLSALPPTPFDLPPPLYSSSQPTEFEPKKAFALPEPEYNWLPKHEISASIFTPLEQPRAAKRPRIKRRDTPIPLEAKNYTSLQMSRFEGERRRLTSVIDGGAWIVVGN